MIVLVLLAEVVIFPLACIVAMRAMRSRPTLRTLVWVVIGCVGILTFGATALYAELTQGGARKSAERALSTAGPPGLGSPQSMVARLANHLREDPRDLSGWLMLGRSYIVLREYPRSVRAYRHAAQLTNETNVEALLGEAQALMLVNETSITGHAGDLVEHALSLAPSDPNALYFGAVVAMHRGQLAVARARFKKLLTLNLPASFRSAIEKQMASLSPLGRFPLAVLNSPGAMGPSEPSGSGPAILVQVRLSPSLAKRVPSGAPLYVFVSDPGRSGPPLAVKRLVSSFPQTVVLSAADSMMPGRAFTAGERVQVVARIAPGGNPLDASGDLSGQASYVVGRTGIAKILINHVTP